EVDLISDAARVLARGDGESAVRSFHVAVAVTVSEAGPGEQVIGGLAIGSGLDGKHIDAGLVDRLLPAVDDPGNRNGDTGSRVRSRRRRFVCDGAHGASGDENRSAGEQAPGEPHG